MTAESMTSLERVLTTLSHQEPDRVPLILLVTMHGAKELGLTIEEYYAKGEHVAEGQLRLRARYGHDCLYSFFHAPLEVMAFGGEAIYYDDGPPNSGEPPIRRAEQIRSLEPPAIRANAGLQEVLKATALLKEQAGADAPIIGVVMSPFSLPVMQMGFDHYLELMLEQPELFARLMAVNEEFCVAWANAQLAAGATAICYFDPVASTTITTRELYLQTGWPVAKRTLARIQGPTATHMASGRCLPIVDDIAQTGSALLCVSALEDLATLKAAARGKISLLGNLNGLTMRHWTPDEAVAQVKAAVAAGGPGGGFLLGDNHGEIPWQVPEEVLMAIAEAAREFGRYPLTGEVPHGD